MGRASKVLSTALVVSLFATSVLIMMSPAASALTWVVTTDADFSAPDTVFTGTRVIGTGVPASVVLLKDAVDWKNENPASPPAAREGPSLTFASSVNVSILFGGYDGSFYRNDTWEYNLTQNTWTQVTTTGQPPARQSAGMSYDPVEKVVVLFGGFDSNGFMSDTWEYDPATRTWTETTPATSPPPLASNPLVYDGGAQRHILVGWSTATTTFETWAYNAAANTWQFRTFTGPGVRGGHGLAYSAARSRTVLFGGGSPNPPPFGTILGDTWEFNSANSIWTNANPGSPPPARARHHMEYRPSDGSVLLFGGGDATGLRQDTWQYTNAGVWNFMSTQVSPSPRRDAGFSFDTLMNAGTLFGGRDPLANPLGDTWSLGPAYRVAGKWASGVFDSGGANADWQSIYWNKTPANQPPNTFLRFQLGASDTSNNTSFSFSGPNGQVNTYYTTPGEATWVGLDSHRYLRILADFGSFDDHGTPVLEDIGINYDVPPAPPFIVSTDPPDLTFDVPQDKVVRITFSEPMDPAAVTVQFLMGPNLTFTHVWSNGDSILDLTHPGQPFRENTVYQLQVFGQDKQGDFLVPGPAPNPWIFVTAKVYPYIVTTNPSNSAVDVPLANPIVVTFSEPMDTASLSVTISPNLGLTPSWSANEDVVTLSHATPFTQCIEYTVTVAAKDKVGLDLVPGPVANPFSFISACISPYIKTISPLDLAGNVAINAPVVVDFSKAMNPSSSGMTISPGVGGQTPTWSVGDTRLTMTHTQAFSGCQVYTVTVTGQDTAGNPLIPGPPGSPPNPWKFVTVCANPYIVATFPADQEVNVSVTQSIFIAFSEAMQTTSVRYTAPGITVTGEVWGADVQLELQHDPLQQCTRYTIQVTDGRNQAGNPLVPGPAPNPWSFSTICEAPQITSTDPADGDGLVPVNQPIVVTFSEPMDPLSVTTTPAPFIAFGYAWSNNNRTLNLSHLRDFDPCIVYTITVTGTGADGNSLAPGPVPNPWSFTTRCVTSSPYVGQTDPANGTQNVPLTKSIVVEFSEAIDTTSFQVTIVPAITLVRTWSAGDTIVTLSHTADLADCRAHTVTVSAQDLNGNPLINVTGSRPNPWTFTTACVAPTILSTNPAAGATAVSLSAPIFVTFSKGMDTASAGVTIAPTITLVRTWSAGDTLLTLTHAAQFGASTTYTVTITGRDKSGTNLVPGPVPNPWSFTTASFLPPPAGLQVIRGGADIRLTWRASTGATSYVVYSSTDRFASAPWPVLGEVTTTSFVAGGHGGDGLVHYYLVRAKDSAGTLSGDSTMGAKVPIRLTFAAGGNNVYWVSLPYNTMYKTARDISDELTGANIDVVGKWNPATQSSILWFYFRGRWRGTDFAINPGDGLFVGARSTYEWVVNGTDRDVPRTFTVYPPPNGNVNWISLPYASAYRTASDLVIDIEGSIGPTANTKIVEVVKWDSGTQSIVVYRWTTSGWTGTDFAIASGEGIYLRVVATFTWTPRLLTPEVP